MQNKNIYTMENWRAAGTFNARPGQEITPDIYAEMRDALPPIDLNPAATRTAQSRTGGPVNAGFLMGEPATNDRDGLLYHAFTMRETAGGNRYFYAGLMHRPRNLNGTYYRISGGRNDNSEMILATEFYTEADAIRTAKSRNAALFEYEYQDGEQTSFKKIYDPFFD